MARKRAIIPNGRKQFSRSEASRKRPELDAGKRYVVFSFSQMTGCRVYNFEYFTDSKRTGEAAEKIKGFLDKLIDISSITWDEFHARPKATGYEPMGIDAMEESFLNGLSPRPKKGEKLYVVRFKGSDGRFILRRGMPGSREPSDVAYVLGIDCGLTLYDHGG